MIGREKRMLLRHYLDEGLSKSAIARKLDLSRDTIHRLIRTGELDRDLEAPVRYGPRSPVATKLEPYRGIIAARLEAYPLLSAVRLFEEVKAAGYSGGYTQVKEFIRSVRPCPAPEPVVRFETPPGLQAQVDFAEFRFPWGKRYALVVVLGYSRLLWLRFYQRQDMRSLVALLQHRTPSPGLSQPGPATDRDSRSLPQDCTGSCLRVHSGRQSGLRPAPQPRPQTVPGANPHRVQMQQRHRADQSTLDDFADEVLVVCPACERAATMRLLRLEEPLSAGPFRAQGMGKLVCTHCGYNAQRPAFIRWTNGPADSVFNRPVWLQAACCGQTLWAYNERHLSAMEAFVRATIRERRPHPDTGWRNKAWVSRIPQWISAAKNRDEVLQCIARIRRERLDPL